MKKILILLNVAILYIFIPKFLGVKVLLRKISDDDVCEQECKKVSMTSGCYCDKDCTKYKDCCGLYLKKCENYFDRLSKNENAKTGSCCNKSDNISNCFCDSQCEKLGDCCEDYNKCKNNTVENRLTGHRINISDNANYTLTPQIQTIYIKSDNPQLNPSY